MENVDSVVRAHVSLVAKAAGRGKEVTWEETRDAPFRLFAKIPGKYVVLRSWLLSAAPEGNQWLAEQEVYDGVAEGWLKGAGKTIQWGFRRVDTSPVV